MSHNPGPVRLKSSSLRRAFHQYCVIALAGTMAWAGVLARPSYQRERVANACAGEGKMGLGLPGYEGARGSLARSARAVRGEVSGSERGTDERAQGFPVPSHVVIVIEENKAYQDVIGSSFAPYLNHLAKEGASFQAFYALHHPSQPNYIELFSGANQGVINDDCIPNPPAFKAPSLGGALISKGYTFAGYGESLPDPLVCFAFPFGQKHTPWVDFTDVPATDSLDFRRGFPRDAAGFSKLPTVSLVIPNLLNDMHNPDPARSECKRGSATLIQQEVCAGDEWLKANLSNYEKWARRHNSLLIITWDEDSSLYKMPPPGINTTPPQNRIPTIMAGSTVKKGPVKDQYNTYDLLRTIEDFYGLPRLGGSAAAKPITGIWR